MHKNIELHECPVHHCKPEWLKHVYVEAREETVLGKVHLIPEQSDWIVYCPECRALERGAYEDSHSSLKKEVERFGIGFSSQYGLKAAQQNWNKACLRFSVRTLTNTIKGKIE